MKNIIFFFLTLFALSVHAETYNYKITRIVDGDTVEFQADFLPKPLKPVLSLRVYGVDTPEKGARAKCSREDIRGRSATEYTAKVVNQAKDRKIVIQSWDKYGGRVLGDVVLDGVSLRSLLIQNGYAREYYGDAKKSWCD